MITLIYAGWLPHDMCPSGAASIYLRESRCSRVSNSRCQGFSFRMPDPRPTARLHSFVSIQGCAICPMAQMNPRSSRATATTATVDFLFLLVSRWNRACSRFSHFCAMSTIAFG